LTNDKHAISSLGVCQPIIDYLAYLDNKTCLLRTPSACPSPEKYFIYIQYGSMLFGSGAAHLAETIRFSSLKFMCG